MAKNTKENAEKTRQLILDAALDNFYEKGYTRSTLTDIAQRVHLTKGALYWHFSSKVDLFFALVEVLQAEAEVKVNMLFRESENLTDLQRVTYQFIKTLIEDERIRKYYAILYTKMEWQDELAPVMTLFSQQDAKLRRRIITILTKEQERGNINPKHNPQSIAVAWLSMVGGYLFRLLKYDDGDEFMLESLHNAIGLFEITLKNEPVFRL